MHRKILCIIAIMAIVMFAAGLGHAAGLPDTGQTKCYDNEEEISCPPPGSDFYGQDAEYVKARSYTDLGNGIVRDNVTGLEWQQASSPETYMWWEAPGYCAGLSLGGHDDWRVPTIQELSSLVDSNRINPAIDPIFNTVAGPSDMYWSSNYDLYDHGYAWMVAIDTAGYVYSVEDSAMLNVRAVRGNPLPINNFIANGDGTVTDTSTGLMWQQATAPGTYTWQQALAYCANLNLAGQTDWRLPDRTELQSLVDYNIDHESEFSDDTVPVIDPLFSNVGGEYWSSTTYALNTIYAWSVSISAYSVVVNRNKTANRNVLAVRSGEYVLLGDLGYLCIEDYHCDEGEVCDEGLCEEEASECVTDEYCDDDGLFCTGEPVCTDGVCGFSGDPCDGLICVEDSGECVECLNDDDCTEGSECVDGECQLLVQDDPPALGDGPYVAADAWPLLSASQQSPAYLKQNCSVLWTFSDDFSSCSGDCSHTAEYKVLGTETWESLAVSSDAAEGYAYAELPITELQNANTYAFRFTVTDCAGQSTQSDEYYFRVATSDAPPVITGGPWLAAGSWPMLRTSPTRAAVLTQNEYVLWTFSDDYASCAGLCTHRARYKKVEDTVWTWLSVSTDTDGTWYAYTTLPVESLDAGTYQFYFDVRDCAGQRTYSPRTYYFKVE